MWNRMMQTAEQKKSLARTSVTASGRCVRRVPSTAVPVALGRDSPVFAISAAMAFQSVLNSPSILGVI